ncbi:Hsp20/alpha crystallin family protein [Nocardiopsis sp. FIRDI 009]|uniref:Hsp20/alpha crystallin family protein n=1 Tax=Nocardiopsis sp. FIRDI 009 TaxID=714197 RepID=UPI000E276270|nr:Hsp20 family protein [Nocardiopsis sp. FIRDI 009]
MMLMRTDPFQEFERITQRLLGDAVHPVVMPIDAYREGDEFVVRFDLPGVRADSIDLEIERNVLTCKAERPLTVPEGSEAVVAERPSGKFSRQLYLGEELDTDNMSAEYADGVLTVTIPVAEKAKPRRISITGGGGRKREIKS